MAKKIINQNSFSSGVLSPDLYLRTDAQEYARGGLQQGVNAQVDSRGGIRKRNGSSFVSKASTQTAASRLIKYRYSPTVTFMLEFSEAKIRFLNNDSQVVESAKTITGITAASPGVVTSTGHLLATDDVIYIQAVVGMTEINSSTIPYRVVWIDANTFSLKTLDGTAVDTSAYTAYGSAGTATRIYTLTSPYTLVQLENLSWYQDGNVVYFVHPDVTPYRLFRTTDTDWTFEAVVFDIPPTYEFGHSPAATVTLAALTGTSITATASVGFFLDSDIGRQIKDIRAGKFGTATIMGVTSTTVATVDITTDFTDLALLTTEWKIDLSPIAQLTFSNPQKGSITLVNSGWLSTNKTTTSLNITNIVGSGSIASPPIFSTITTSTVHGYVGGERILIDNIIGATQFNGNEFLIQSVPSTTTFVIGQQVLSGQLISADGVSLPVPGAYISGGTISTSFNGSSFTSQDAFRTEDIGKYILANGGVMKILSVVSAAQVKALVVKSLNEVYNTNIWSLESDMWNATDGYPWAVAVYDQRAFYIGSTGFPHTIWGSEIGLYTSFGVGPDDEDALQLSLVAEQAFTVSWARANRELIIGTTIGEFAISSGSTSSSITPTNNTAVLRTHYGSKLQSPLEINDELLFVQNSARKIRAYTYGVEGNAYTAEDLAFLIKHLTKFGIHKLAFAKEPNSILLAVTNDWKLLCGTYDRGQKMVAWTEWETDGYVKDVETLDNDGVDQIWVCVERNIGGVLTHNIEVINYALGGDHLDAFTDSALTYSVPITVTSVVDSGSTATITATSHGLVAADEFVIKDLEDPLTADLDAAKTNMSTINNNSYVVVSAPTAHTLTVTIGTTVDYNPSKVGTGKIHKLVSTVTGLDHLEGKTVSIRADGAVQPNAVVTSGAVTLTYAAGEVVTGLPFTLTLNTLPIPYDLGMGNMLGQDTRWVRPMLYVVESTSPFLDSNDEQPVRNTEYPMDQAIPLYTGFLTYGDLEYKKNSSILITSSEPLPVYLLGYTGTIEGGVS